MLRCQAEIHDRNNDKKLDEGGLVPFASTERLTFDELLTADGASWRAMTDPDSLRCVAGRVRRMLKSADFDRCVLWFILERGLALARGAGLLPSGLRAERVG